MNKKYLLNLASKAGHGQQALRIVDNVSDITDISFEVDNRIKRDVTEDTDSHGRILIPYVRGGQLGAGYIFGVLAQAFRMRGYEVDIILCYNDQKLCNKKSPEWNDNARCEHCHYNGKKLLNKFGLDFISISDIFPDYTFPQDINEIDVENYRGINIERFAKASTRRYLERYRIEFDQEPYSAIYTDFLRSAILHVDICHELGKQLQYDGVIGFDPVYNVSGIYLQHFNQRDTPAYSIGKGYRQDYLIFGKANNKEMQPQFSDLSNIHEFLETPLSNKQKHAIDSVFTDRQSGESVQAPIFSNTDHDLKISSNLAIGMFTNLIWDGSLEISTAPFPDVYEWIFGSIDYFVENPQLQLIVRTHPVETLRGTNESVADEINKEFPSLPDNVTIIPPSTDVNTYSLFSEVDVGVVYNSTVGLELAYQGIPVIVGGDTHYRNLGFTFDPDSPDEYFSLLGDVEYLSISNEQQEMAQRYAYYLFIKKHIYFPHIQFQRFTGHQFTDLAYEDIDTNNETINNICDSIIEYESIVNQEQVNP